MTPHRYLSDPGSPKGSDTACGSGTHACGRTVNARFVERSDGTSSSLDSAMQATHAYRSADELEVSPIVGPGDQINAGPRPIGSEMPWKQLPEFDRAACRLRYAATIIQDFYPSQWKA